MIMHDISWPISKDTTAYKDKRALERAVEIDLGSVRMRGELQRERKRDGDDRQARERSGGEGRDRAEFGRFIRGDAIGGIGGKHQHA